MTFSKTISLGALAALVLLATGACDSTGPDGPRGPGSFLATLVSPNGDEGSAVFELTGGVELGAVTGFGGEVFHQHFGGSTRVVVVLDQPGQISFRIGTGDVGEPPEAAVIQVADGENELRPSVAAYRVEITEVEAGSGSQMGGSP
jgi:hypothetical protein